MKFIDYISICITTAVISLAMLRFLARKMWKPRKTSHKRSSRSKRGNQYDYRKHLAVLIQRDAWRCALCNELIDPFAKHPHPDSLSIDHILPLAKGGTHDLDNLQLTHLRCNLKKGAGSRKRPRKR